MIIIDTHVWLWLLHDPNQLSNAARAQIEIEGTTKWHFGFSYFGMGDSCKI